MKKVILSLIAACGLSTAFAQFNETILYQTGNGQMAQVRQDGQLLQASVNQQDGDGQGGNQAKTRQSGYSESIRVDQSGSYNEVYLAQVSQSTVAQSRQVGTENRITSVQRSNERAGASADFYQNGSSNQITLDQINYERGSSARFYQYGLENGAFVSQHGGDNLFRLEQNGDNNTAGFSQDGLGNQALFRQLGDHNTIQGLNGRSRASQNGNFNSLDITQLGDYQKASVGQNGYNNMVSIYQTSNPN